MRPAQFHLTRATRRRAARGVLIILCNVLDRGDREIGASYSLFAASSNTGIDLVELYARNVSSEWGLKY